MGRIGEDIGIGYGRGGRKGFKGIIWVILANRGLFSRFVGRGYVGMVFVLEWSGVESLAVCLLVILGILVGRGERGMGNWLSKWCSLGDWG